jgi:separase
MAALVARLEADGLGPWRCLLLPLPAGRRGALLAAAAAFAAEHLPPAAGGSSAAQEPPDVGGVRRALLHELLAAALAGAQAFGEAAAGELLACVASCLRGSVAVAAPSLWDLGGSGGGGCAAALGRALVAATAAVELEGLRLGPSGPLASSAMDASGGAGGEALCDGPALAAASALADVEAGGVPTEAAREGAVRGRRGASRLATLQPTASACALG